jgi:hypothetical protein
MFAESWHTAVGLLRIAHDACAGRQEFEVTLINAIHARGVPTRYLLGHPGL